MIRVFFVKTVILYDIDEMKGKFFPFISLTSHVFPFIPGILQLLASPFFRLFTKQKKADWRAYKPALQSA
jgi:hypothetical protein